MEQATFPKRPEELTKLTQSNALAAIVPQIMNSIGGGDRRTQEALMQQQQQNDVRMEKQKEQMFMRSIMTPGSGEITQDLLMQQAALYNMPPQKAMQLFMEFDAHRKAKAQERIKANATKIGLKYFGLSDPTQAIREDIQSTQPQTFDGPTGLPTSEMPTMNPEEVAGGISAYQAMIPKQKEGFNLSPGQKRFDASGREIASIPALPKTIDKKPTLEQYNQLQDMITSNEPLDKINHFAKTFGFGQYQETKTGKRIKVPGTGFWGIGMDEQDEKIIVPVDSGATITEKAQPTEIKPPTWKKTWEKYTDEEGNPTYYDTATKKTYDINGIEIEEEPEIPKVQTARQTISDVQNKSDAKLNVLGRSAWDQLKRWSQEAANRSPRIK